MHFFSCIFGFGLHFFSCIYPLKSYRCVFLILLLFQPNSQDERKERSREGYDVSIAAQGTEILLFTNHLASSFMASSILIPSARATPAP